MKFEQTKTVKRGDEVTLEKSGLNTAPTDCDWTLPYYHKDITTYSNKEIQIKRMEDVNYENVDNFANCKSTDNGQTIFENCTFTKARPISTEWTFTPLGYPAGSKQCGLRIFNVDDADSGTWNYDYDNKEDYRLIVEGEHK